MRIFKSFFILLVLIPIGLSAQIQARLHQPPPNKLMIEHLWWVDLHNQSPQTYTVFLRGRIIEEEDGLIFKANSNEITLSPGMTRIRPRDITEVKDVTYNPEYKEFIIRTGTVPEGEYEVCVDVIDAQTGQMYIENHCITVIVRFPEASRLISPRHDVLLKQKKPLFTWTQPTPFPSGERVTYRLRIVEVLEGQTLEEAIRANKPWFEQKGLTRASLNYPSKARPFEIDKTYAWQIQAYDRNGYPLGKNNGLSEIWRFRLRERIPVIERPRVLYMGDFILKEINYTSGSLYDSLSGTAQSFFLEKRLPGHYGGPIFVYAEVPFEVNFTNLKITRINADTGRVIEGEIAETFASPVEVMVELYYPVYVHDIHLWPDSAHGTAGIGAPCLFEETGCEPAELGPFDCRLSPHIEIYKELGIMDRGPFRIGETGILVMSKEEIEIDLSRTITPTKIGITFRRGETVEQPAMDTSNTGYLYGRYTFDDGLLTPYGFSATLELASPWVFTSVAPMGYRITLNNGYLEIDTCRVLEGKFSSGDITLPYGDHGVKNSSGNPVVVNFDSLLVDSLLNLSGDIHVKQEMQWGGFGYYCTEGKFRLPADPYPYYPVAQDDSFPVLYPDIDTLIGLAMEMNRNNDTLIVYTKDARSFLKFREMGSAWFNLEMQGMRGYVASDVETPTKQVYLGHPGAPGYRADSCFATQFRHDDSAGTYIKFWFVGNSAFDADLGGGFKIPYPCKIQPFFKNPPLRDMEVTSTATLVGGKVEFSDTLTLEYWGVGITSERGIVSVKVGEIVYTNADIHEPAHFSKGFNIVWGEMFADGDLGEFFFNHNAANQKFDGFPITLDSAALSRYDPSRDGELVVRCGIHFNFFGEPDTIITIHDAKYSKTSPPFYGRYVTTDPETFALYRNWGSGLSEMDFDAVGYDETDQNGFVGDGDVDLAFFVDSPLYADIDIDSHFIKICISETRQHNLALLHVNLTGLGQIWGCAAIEGDELERIVIGARMETTVGGGFEILVPKAGVGVEVKMAITPNISQFVAEGMMYLYVFGADLELTGHVALTCDRANLSVEGDVSGAFDLSALGVDIEADGQANWHFGIDANYIQGKLGVKISTLAIGAGLSGGLFIGYNAPKEKVWVLREGSSLNRRFGVNMDNLPSIITGAYVFGDVDFTIGAIGIIEGGIEIYAGVGAFLNYTGSDAQYDPSLPAPYVVAIVGIYIHGEILWGIVSASAWGELELYLGHPTGFEGTVGLRGCILWVLCASVDVTVGWNTNKGFYID